MYMKVWGAAVPNTPALFWGLPPPRVRRGAWGPAAPRLDVHVRDSRSPYKLASLHGSEVGYSSDDSADVYHDWKVFISHMQMR